MARYYPPGGGTGGSGSSVDLDQITVPRRLVPSGYKTLTSDSIGEMVEGTLPLLKETAFGDSSNVVGVAFESSPIKLAVNNNAVGGFDYVLNGYFDDTVNGTMTRVHIPNCIPSNIAAGVKVGGKDAYLVGTFSADATGIASDIKMGKTVYVNGIKVTGTMPVRTAINSTLTAGSSVEMPEGYYPASKVTAKSLADQTKATAVAAHILKGDTAWIDGVLVTGSMPNIASIDAVKSLYDKTEVSTLFARISKGAHITDATSGYPEVSIPYADIVSASGITADKIAAGNSIFGVAGTFSSDANAVAEDIKVNKSVYVNGKKLNGTMPVNSKINTTLNAGNSINMQEGYYPAGNITATSLADQTAGTAVASDIKNTKTAWVNGVLVIGNMPVRAAINSTINAGTIVDIPAGYYPASKITANSLASQTSSNALPGDIKNNRTAWVSGKLITGTMPVNAGINRSIGPGTTVEIPEGYYPAGKIISASLVNYTQGTATARDILNGKTAWVNGVRVTGSMMIKSVYSFRIAPSGSVYLNISFRHPKVGGIYGGVIVTYRPVRGASDDFPTTINDGTVVTIDFGDDPFSIGAIIPDGLYDIKVYDPNIQNFADPGRYVHFCARAWTYCKINNIAVYADDRVVYKFAVKVI